MFKKIIKSYVLILLIISLYSLESKPVENNNFVLKSNKKYTIETPYNGIYLYTESPYPCPAKNKVNTLVYWDYRYNFSNKNILVYNANGIKVSGKERITVEPRSSWSGVVTWDANGFTAGIYFIVIKHSTTSKTVKVVIG